MSTATTTQVFRAKMLHVLMGGSDHPISVRVDAPTVDSVVHGLAALDRPDASEGFQKIVLEEMYAEASRIVPKVPEYEDIHAFLAQENADPSDMTETMMEKLSAALMHSTEWVEVEFDFQVGTHRISFHIYAPGMLAMFQLYEYMHSDDFRDRVLETR